MLKSQCQEHGLHSGNIACGGHKNGLLLMNNQSRSIVILALFKFIVTIMLIIYVTITLIIQKFIPSKLCPAL